MQYLQLVASGLIGEGTVQHFINSRSFSLECNKLRDINNNITEALCFYETCLLFSA